MNTCCVKYQQGTACCVTTTKLRIHYQNQKATNSEPKSVSLHPSRREAGEPAAAESHKRLSISKDPNGSCTVPQRHRSPRTTENKPTVLIGWHHWTQERKCLGLGWEHRSFHHYIWYWHTPLILLLSDQFSLWIRNTPALTLSSSLLLTVRCRGQTALLAVSSPDVTAQQQQDPGAQLLHGCSYRPHSPWDRLQPKQNLVLIRLNVTTADEGPPTEDPQLNRLQQADLHQCLQHLAHRKNSKKELLNPSGGQPRLDGGGSGKLLSHSGMFWKLLWAAAPRNSKSCQPLGTLQLVNTTEENRIHEEISLLAKYIEQQFCKDWSILCPAATPATSPQCSRVWHAHPGLCSHCCHSKPALNTGVLLCLAEKARRDRQNQDKKQWKDWTTWQKTQLKSVFGKSVISPSSSSSQRWPRPWRSGCQQSDYLSRKQSQGTSHLFHYVIILEFSHRSLSGLLLLYLPYKNYIYKILSKKLETSRNKIIYVLFSSVAFARRIAVPQAN